MICASSSGSRGNAAVELLSTAPSMCETIVVAFALVHHIAFKLHSRAWPSCRCGGGAMRCDGSDCWAKTDVRAKLHRNASVELLQDGSPPCIQRGALYALWTFLCFLRRLPVLRVVIALECCPISASRAAQG